MRVHFIVHEQYEAPGVIEAWASRHGHAATYSRVYAGEPLPAVGALDLLVVMGGPQDPSTSLSECPHFDGPAEMRLIAACVQAGRAVLGVCLGAQLIGQALGAPAERSPEPEIGSFPVMLTAAGIESAILAGFPEAFEAGHWHGGMPGLTSGARVLATSAGCPRQIVEYGPLVYGFQCHMEFTSALVEGLIENCADDLRSLRERPFIQQPGQLRANRYGEMNALLCGFLDRLAAGLTPATAGTDLTSS